MNRVAPGTLASLGRSSTNDLVGSQLPRRALRFQGDEHSALVLGCVSPRESNDGLHVLVLHHDRDELLHFLFHRRERDVLISLHRTHDSAGVLLRKESLGHQGVEVNRQRGCGDGDQQRSSW